MMPNNNDKTPMTPQKAVDALLRALDLREEDTAEVQITSGGRIRILGRDRSFRSVPIERFKREAAK